MTIFNKGAVLGIINIGSLCSGGYVQKRTRGIYRGIYQWIGELHGDQLSRHAYPVEGAVFLWRSTKKS